MYSQVDLALKKSTENHKKEIGCLLRTAEDWEFFFINSSFAIHHYKLFTKIFENYENVPKYEEQCIELTLRYDTTQLVFFDLWRELGLAIRELISSNYEAVSRSLRWMIEATIIWADMQLDIPNSLDIYTDFLAKKLTKKEYDRKFLEIYAVVNARFSERLLYKEKYHIVKIADIVNKLRILKNRQKGEEKHLLREKIFSLYSEFSTYAHCTLESLEEIKSSKRYDFAIYQGYGYNPRSFNNELRNIYQTIDVCLAIILLVNTEFYGYESPRLFMETVESGGAILASETCQLKEQFPFLDTILTVSLPTDADEQHF